MFTRTFVLFLRFYLYTFIIIFVIMSEKGRECLERGCCVVWLSQDKSVMVKSY